MKVLVEERRIVRHGLLYIQYGRKLLVLHGDELQGLFSHVSSGRGHGGHRMALEQHLIARKDMVAGELEPQVIATQLFSGQ